MLDILYTKHGKELPFGYTFSMRPLDVDDDGNIFVQTGIRIFKKKDGKKIPHVYEMTQMHVVSIPGDWGERLIQEAIYDDKGVIQSITQFDSKTGDKCLHIEEFDHHRNPQERYYKKQNGVTWNGHYEGGQFSGAVTTERGDFLHKEKFVYGALKEECKKYKNEKGHSVKEHTIYDYSGNIEFRKTRVGDIEWVDYKNGKIVDNPVFVLSKHRTNELILKCVGLAVASLAVFGLVKLASHAQKPDHKVPPIEQVNQRS